MRSMAALPLQAPVPAVSLQPPKSAADPAELGRATPSPSPSAAVLSVPATVASPPALPVGSGRPSSAESKGRSGPPSVPVDLPSRHADGALSSRGEAEAVYVKEPRVPAAAASVPSGVTTTAAAAAPAVKEQQDVAAGREVRPASVMVRYEEAGKVGA